MKFPQGEGSAVIHRKKNRPALQRRDILTVSLVSLFFFFFFFFYFFFWDSESTQFLVLFFVAFYSAPFSSKHFFLGLFVRSLPTQLFVLVVLLLLLLSMAAFSYVGLLFSLLSVTFWRCFPKPSSTELFSWGVVVWAVCRARIRSFVSFFSSGLFFGLRIFRVSVLNNVQGRFHILSSFWCVCSEAFLSLVILLISAILRPYFSYFSHRHFMYLLPCFLFFWFCSF